ncbi:LysR family transcriptional regulator [Halopseudomonas aestusnigri]|jgi:DNA-binding transcriptional LysR family regulator|nr:transcriptional regulator [Pseudomonadales bacterium]BDX18764.1 LysR family transcriptional regulator [Halopseudomonas aestusnigri]GMQ55308.1 LysR family transcriptional regulator [Halopseudomonas aestusnigri]HBT58356.1 transcriptional regulator [Pseudomonas sp.]|tara:strand:- start:1444 stop:2361 length:918 start_codon:yes stop_codon:yes gene_type:complete
MQDMNDLLCFARVVRFGGFAAAERATGERKSKLSKRVARLETHFGARLIERSTRHFRVTDLGRELYRECEVILQRLESAEALAMTARDEVSGTVRVSMSSGMLEYLGRDTLVDFMTRYPQVRVQIRLSSQRIDLINERIDVAFRVATRFDTDQSLAMRSLGVGARILAASPTLLQRMGGAPAQLEDLSRFPTLSVGEMLERDRWEFANDAGETCDLHHAPHFSCGDLQLICEAAVAGQGVVLLPEHICEPEVRSGRLVHILPQWHALEGQIHMVFTTPRGMLPPVRAFIDHCVETLAQRGDRAAR